MSYARAFLLSITLTMVGFLMSVVFVPMQASAAPCEPNKSFLGIPTWYKYLDGETDSFGRCNPRIENTRGALPIGIAILEALLRLGGIVAVVMVMIGGFKFITSQGNPDSAAGARKTVVNALIGLVLVIMATGIVSFIGSNIKDNAPAPASSYMEEYHELA